LGTKTKDSDGSMTHEWTKNAITTHGNNGDNNNKDAVPDFFLPSLSSLMDGNGILLSHECNCNSC
jgi:hypothetical protein